MSENVTHFTDGELPVVSFSFDDCEFCAVIYSARYQTSSPAKDYDVLVKMWCTPQGTIPNTKMHYVI